MGRSCSVTWKTVVRWIVWRVGFAEGRFLPFAVLLEAVLLPDFVLVFELGLVFAEVPDLDAEADLPFEDVFWSSGVVVWAADGNPPASREPSRTAI